MDLSGSTPLKVVIAGAGTMGTGIAAHLANLGHSVTLADLSIETAVKGIDRKREANPPAFCSGESVNRIQPIGLDQLEEALVGADWFCEAIVEKLDLKRALLARAAKAVGPDTLVSTNTSGLQIELLTEGQSDDFKSRFVGAHFFNPPRQLKLLELIPTASTRPEITQRFRTLLEDRLARRVVVAKDTPGFIANRLGMWSMFQAVHTAERLGLTVEETDLITGPFLGRPKSASFRLNDLVGLDVMQDIATNLLARCPHDPMIGALNCPRSLKGLLELGRLGAKTGQGWYRREGKDILALDFNTMAYRPAQKPRFDLPDGWKKLPLGQRIAEALQTKGEVGEFLRECLVPTLRYAHSIRQEIAHSVLDIDRVMMWGFGWQFGPFEMIDMIGADRLGIASKPFYTSGAMLDIAGSEYEALPDEPNFVQLDAFPVVESTESVSLREAPGDILILALKTKMGSVSPKAVKDLTSLLTARSPKGWVLTSEAPSFSVGYDLNVFKAAIEAQDFDSIDANLQELQALGALLETKNIVSILHGYALGGGLELALSCPFVVASLEAKLGLPESRVGLLPGGRGSLLLRRRTISNLKLATDAAILICRGTIVDNAVVAKEVGLLREGDVIEVHPDRLLRTAIDLAAENRPVEVPSWLPSAGPLVGMIDHQVAALKAKGEFTNHDAVIAEKVKQVFVKASSEADSLEKERRGFVDLCRSPLTAARIRFMLESGKPLRN